jgi:hypothetical protein
LASTGLVSGGFLLAISRFILVIYNQFKTF